MWKTARDDVRILGMLLNDGENIMPRSLEAGGLSPGVSSACHFFHKGLQTYLLVHGDDFFMVGRCEGRNHAQGLLQGAY